MLRPPPEGTVGLGEVGHEATAVHPPAGVDVEEHQVGHQGHGQQHNLQLQAHPQEDRASDKGQDAATGVILGVGGRGPSSGSSACTQGHQEGARLKGQLAASEPPSSAETFRAPGSLLSCLSDLS